MPTFGITKYVSMLTREMFDWVFNLRREQKTKLSIGELYSKTGYPKVENSAWMPFSLCTTANCIKSSSIH